MKIREVKMVYGEVICDSPTPIKNATDIVKMFDFLTDSPKEEFWVALVNSRNEVFSTSKISVGTLTASLVHPREIFQPAIVAGAAGVVLVHNHPSGDCTPSKEDDAVTDRIRKAGELLGIRMIDHLVIGDGRYYSYNSKTEVNWRDPR